MELPEPYVHHFFFFFSHRSVRKVRKKGKEEREKEKEKEKKAYVVVQSRTFRDRV